MIINSGKGGGAYTLAAGGSLYFALQLDDDPILTSVVKSIYVDSLQLPWQVSLGFSLLGFLLTFVAKEIHMRSELETEFNLTEKPMDKADEPVATEKMSNGSA